MTKCNFNLRQFMKPEKLRWLGCQIRLIATFRDRIMEIRKKTLDVNIFRYPALMLSFAWYPGQMSSPSLEISWPDIRYIPNNIWAGYPVHP